MTTREQDEAIIFLINMTDQVFVETIALALRNSDQRDHLVATLEAIEFDVSCCVSVALTDVTDLAAMASRWKGRTTVYPMT